MAAASSLSVVCAVLLWMSATPLPDLWPFPKAMLYKPISLEQALRQPQTHTALVLVVGIDRPSRRDSAKPLLSFSPQAVDLVPAAVQQLLGQCMQQLERLGVGGRFGLQLDVLPPWPHNPDGLQLSGSSPLAVFDVSTGRVLLSQPVLSSLYSTPVQVVSAATQATIAAAKSICQAAGQVVPSSLAQLVHSAPRAAAAGVAVAFAATVPRWFCFVCPIVLGLLAPLVINAGVGEAADMACKAMKLPDDDCVELWFTALGLGMILSLLCAIPIYKVCRLYECAHPGPNSTVTATM